jgi:hypothetical protein
VSATTKLRTKQQSLSPEERRERARKAALARWQRSAPQREVGSQAFSLIRNKRKREKLIGKFLNSLAQSYIKQFASSPEVLAELIQPLSSWASELKLPPEESNGDCN